MVINNKSLKKFLKRVNRIINKRDNQTNTGQHYKKLATTQLFLLSLLKRIFIYV